MNLRVRIVHDVLVIASGSRRAPRKDGARVDRARGDETDFREQNTDRRTRVEIESRPRSRSRARPHGASRASIDRSIAEATERDTSKGSLFPGRGDARARDGSRGVAMSKAAFAGLKTLQELRFHLCQTSKGSEGVRNFLMSSYKNLKAASPTTPVLIREASGIEGKLYARYDYGVEKCVKLEGLDAKEVEKCLRDLVSSAP